MFNDIINSLDTDYDAFRNWRHKARCMINGIKNKRLYDISWKFVDQYIKPDANYPREIIDLVLNIINHKLYLHKNSLNSKKHNFYLKLYFQGKDIEKLNINKILTKNLKIIPKKYNFIKPTILYKRSKTIGSTIFNYKKVVENVLTNNYKHNNINFHCCDCKSSQFNDPNHGHIVTNDSKIIESRELRSLLMKGPKYREPQNVNWDYFLTNFKKILKDYLKQWVNL